MRDFILYSGSGVVGTAIHYAVFLALLHSATAHQGIVDASRLVLLSTVAALTGALVNYLLNASWMSSRPVRHRRSAPRFALVAATGWGVNAAVVASAAHLGMAALFAQLLATASVLAVGFLLNRYWTFA
ncbi:GtrA family protein [Hydrocarboniphaga effusa]|uniref:GtrA family protein n=1 Tax=Hydrocarboniphaga effusa TaxID=243629 RepID=UPI003BAAD7ED|eukprot:TRINITY_DN9171_c0_g1_i17.p1 TRINITY_DN9171_c0_g1~~TRINITY_DN9171_c0_g1_i17.p1  ORF type:complete len:129 (-),score=13.31 TRINITY_DN9171_c0_g1_i17:29-415(-)